MSGRKIGNVLPLLLLDVILRKLFLTSLDRNNYDENKPE